MSTDSSAHVLMEKANAAFRRAAVKVIERARQTGTPIVIWEDGQVVALSVEEMERRLASKEQEP